MNLLNAVVLVLVFVLPACSNPARDENESWSLALSPDETEWLVSTWGRTTDDRFAVGGNLERGRILHFDGADWSEESIPADLPVINWVFGFEDDTTFAVGNAGTILKRQGTKWNLMESPTTEDLWGIWGASADDVWAVGGSGESDAVATVVHFDGDTWEASDLPELERAGVRAFFKVWGTSADNVYVVGQRGAVLHYDGNAWQEQLVGASDDLIALWGTGPDNIVAIGGRSSAVVSHFDGNDWRSERLDSVPGANGVWMRQENVAHVALTQGYLGKLSVPELEIELVEWDDNLDFHSIFGTSDGTLSAVGGNFEAFFTGEFEGLLVERHLASNE